MAKRKATSKPEPTSDKEENDQTEEEEEEEEVYDSSHGEEEESEEEEEDGEDEEEEIIDEDFSSRDSIKMLLEPFGKDELIDLLKEAALNNPALVTRISASAKRKPTPKPEPSSDKEENDQTEEEEEEVYDSSDDQEVEIEGEEEEDEEENGEDEEEEIKDEDFPSRDSIEMLLEPYSNDQLIDLLKEAALNNPALVVRISALAAFDPFHRKIFVHGLGWDATTEALAAAFAPFGEIEDSNAVLDRATGRCKGYGFVLFCNGASARRALKEPQKQIGSCTTSCQLASFSY